MVATVLPLTGAVDVASSPLASARAARAAAMTGEMRTSAARAREWRGIFLICSARIEGGSPYSEMPSGLLSRQRPDAGGTGASKWRASRLEACLQARARPRAEKSAVSGGDNVQAVTCR